MKARTARLAIDILHGLQAVLSITNLALTITLLIRYENLYDACGDPPYDNQCDNIGVFVGVFKYCIVPPVMALCYLVVWIVDSYVTGLPFRFVVWCGWVLQGFYLGGATTLAARLNSSWHCEADGGGALRLCGQLYADTALFFIATAVVWIQMAFMYRITEYYRPNPRSGYSEAS